MDAYNEDAMLGWKPSMRRAQGAYVNKANACWDNNSTSNAAAASGFAPMSPFSPLSSTSAYSNSDCAKSLVTPKTVFEYSENSLRILQKQSSKTVFNHGTNLDLDTDLDLDLDTDLDLDLDTDLDTLVILVISRSILFSPCEIFDYQVCLKDMTISHSYFHFTFVFPFRSDQKQQLKSLLLPNHYQVGSLSIDKGMTTMVVLMDCCHH